MNIFFDVDDTIIHWIGDDAFLREGVLATFEALVSEGHTLYLWSGVGRRYDVAERFGLDRYITDCFHKPKIDPAKNLTKFGVPFVPDYVIDDYASIVADFRGHVIGRFVPGEDGDEFRQILADILSCALSEH